MLKLQPIYQEKIWGGRLFETMFDDVPSGRLGERWVISAHGNGDCLIAEGPLQGQKLSWVFAHHKELFALDPRTDFPLLLKYIDASDDLSVQVHPDDEYAHTINQPYGKEESWLILKAPQSKLIQLGHHAHDKTELAEMIDNGRWKDLLKYQTIDRDYFVPVRPGTLHAILKGTLLLEIQQASDTTYRVYDYGRLDQAGKPRPLHLKESKEVIAVPDNSVEPYQISTDPANPRQVIFIGKHFSVEQWKIDQSTKLKLTDGYYAVTAIEGAGSINGTPIKQGDSFVLTSLCDEVVIDGSLRLIAAYPKMEPKP
ncbi:MAG: type I phosphomannose isomerase catalytic subunit [Bacilli bacterium]